MDEATDLCQCTRFWRSPCPAPATGADGRCTECRPPLKGLHAAIMGAPHVDLVRMWRDRFARRRGGTGSLGGADS